jgi:hypothetical protein
MGVTMAPPRFDNAAVPFATLTSQIDVATATIHFRLEVPTTNWFAVSWGADTKGDGMTNMDMAVAYASANGQWVLEDQYGSNGHSRPALDAKQSFLNVAVWRPDPAVNAMVATWSRMLDTADTQDVPIVPGAPTNVYFAIGPAPTYGMAHQNVEGNGAAMLTGVAFGTGAAGGASVVVIVLSAIGGLLLVSGAGYFFYQRQKNAKGAAPTVNGRDTTPTEAAYMPVGNQGGQMDDTAGDRNYGYEKSAPVPARVGRVAAPTGSSNVGSVGSPTQKMSVSAQRQAGGGYAPPLPPAASAASDYDRYGDAFASSSSGRRSPRAQSPQRSAPRAQSPQRSAPRAQSPRGRTGRK